jgi:predicted transcriptional regulator
MSRSVTVELDDEIVRSLDRLAERTERSRAELVNDALRDYLDLQDWQIRKIEAGLAAAEQGDFAGDDEIARIAAKYSKPV